MILERFPLSAEVHLSGSCLNLSHFLGCRQDAQLTEARLERDSRRQRKEQEREEKEKLVVHIELLNRLVTYQESVHTPTTFPP